MTRTHDVDTRDERSEFTLFMTYMPRVENYRFADSVKMFQLRRFSYGLPHDSAVILWRTPGTKARYSDYGVTILGEAVGSGRAPLLRNPLPSSELDSLPRLTIAVIAADNVYEWDRLSDNERSLLDWLQRYFFGFTSDSEQHDRNEYWRSAM